jgi:hypothetical protein
MSKQDHIPGTDGYTPDEWREADDWETPSTPADHGEFTWDEYSAAWVRTQEDRKIEKTWGLRWQG